MARRGAPPPLLGRCWLACALVAQVLAEPPSPSPGIVHGNDGAYFRYLHAAHPPTSDELQEAERMSEDVRCEACEALVFRLVNNTAVWVEDQILDAFDGQPEVRPEPPGPSQAELVKYHNRGCNKHFRDDFLAAGWRIYRCPGVDANAEVDRALGLPDAVTKKIWCLKQGPPPGELDLYTFSTFNEGAYNVCAFTVGRYSMELASYIHEKLYEDRERDLMDIVKEACREAGRCEDWKTQRRKAAKKVAKKRKPDSGSSSDL